MQCIDVRGDDVFNYITRILDGSRNTLGYIVIADGTYYSKRYNKYITFRTTDPAYDGATGAKDIRSFGWLIHDVLCNTGVFDDGTPCTNWQASCILSDILSEEGRWFRARTWKYTTWLLGGGKARENSMW